MSWKLKLPCGGLSNFSQNLQKCRYPVVPGMYQLKSAYCLKVLKQNQNACNRQSVCWRQNWISEGKLRKLYQVMTQGDSVDSQSI